MLSFLSASLLINKNEIPTDDFVVSDESSFADEEEEFVSTYLLSGPPGAGKTAAVYALASELGYKVSCSRIYI